VAGPVMRFGLHGFEHVDGDSHVKNEAGNRLFLKRCSSFHAELLPACA
jgi:hypothetical protein